jgi:tetratricopeptide (TPR) repeat protein
VVGQEITENLYENAMEISSRDDLSVSEIIAVLVQFAMQLQERPKSVRQIEQAIALYDRALEVLPDDNVLDQARVRFYRATALQQVPGSSATVLAQCLSELEESVVVLEAGAEAEEAASAHMTIGLFVQALAAEQAANIADAIKHYQKALNVFNKDNYAREHAILQNNLATAYLSISVSDEKAKMREALAVQAFQAALSAINLEEHPNEYAMLQNNLGNALQYSTSAHILENNFRALEAYDEALKVRTVRSSPQTYANTIANKANCLRNLPDDPDDLEKGNPARLAESLILYNEARKIFLELGEFGKAELITGVVQEIEEELTLGSRAT